MAKLAILFILYIAGKSEFLKLLILLLCCLYCVVVLLSMFLLGPRCLYPVLTLSLGPTSNCKSRDGGLPAS